MLYEIDSYATKQNMPHQFTDQLLNIANDEKNYLSSSSETYFYLCEMYL